jgi:hypothetical protein
MSLRNSSATLGIGAHRVIHGGCILNRFAARAEVNRRVELGPILNAARVLAARIAGCEVNNKAGQWTPTSAALIFRP